jgi:DNA-binding NtrC family response regulator
MRHNAQLLVTDNDRSTRQMLAALFKERGVGVEEADSASGALQAAAKRDFDVVLSDVDLPGPSGPDLVGELRRLRPNTPIVLMAESGTQGPAVEAMRAGAFDCLTKPIEREAAIFAVDRALEHAALARENAALKRAAKPAFGEENMAMSSASPSASGGATGAEREEGRSDNGGGPATRAQPGSALDSEELDALLRAAAARGTSLRELDEKYTAIVLEHTGGNKVRASQILGIDRKTLYRRAERRAREGTVDRS